MRSALLLLTALVGLAAAFPLPTRPAAAPALPVRQMEHLGRGLIAVHPEA